MIVKIENIDVNTGSDLDRNVKDAVTMTFSNDKTRSLSTSIYKKAVETLPTDGQDITVFDDDGTTLMFGGVIATVSFDAFTPKTGNEAWIVCNIQSNGYDYIPTRRTIDIIRTNTDWGTIVEEMVDSYLIDEGVTKGTISTGATVGEFNGRLISIKEILDKAASASGYIWYIDNDKVLQFVSPDTPTIATEFIVEGERTHFDFKPVRSLNRFRNKQFFEGGQDSTGEVIRVVVEDSADIASRAVSEGNTGVYGNVYRDSTVQTETDATNAAKELLNRYKSQSASFSSWDRYPLGELIPVTYPKFEIAADTYYLIVKETIKRDKHVWKYSYTTERRDDTDFTSKVKDNGIDFFSKLAERSTTTGGSDLNTFNSPLTTVKKTAIALTAATPYRETFTFNLDRKAYTMITVDSEINCASNAKVDVDVYLDNNLEYSRKKNIASSIDTLNLHTSLSEVEAGEHTIDVDITSDTNGTMNDLKIDAQQFVNLIITLPPDPSLDFTIVTTGASEVFDSPLTVGTSGSIVVDWGDGNEETITTAGNVTHTYATAGTYQVSVKELNDSNLRFNYTARTSIIKSIDTQIPEAFTFDTGLNLNAFARRNSNLESIPNRMFEKVASQFVINGTTVFDLDMSSLFEDCTSLTNVPDNFLYFDQSELSQTITDLDAEQIFEGCTALERAPRLFLDHINMAVDSDIAIDRMFYQCTNLKNASKIKDDYTGLNMDAQSMYYECENLETIEDRLFENCRELRADKGFFRCYNLKSTGRGMFYGYEGYDLDLQGDVDINNLFEEAIIESIDSNFFEGLVNTTSLANGIKEINYIFKEVETDEVPLGLFDPLDGIEEINYTFQDSTISTIPSGLFSGFTSNVELTYIFDGCTNLTTIPTDLFDGNDFITSVRGMFNDCTGVTAYPSGLLDDMTALNDLYRTFKDCTGMTNAADDIWNDYPLATSTECFNGAINLSNFASIPTGWK